MIRIFTWKQRFLVLGITFLSIAAFCGCGALIGYFAGNLALGLVSGLIVSFPITLWLLIRTLLKTIK